MLIEATEAFTDEIPSTESLPDSWVSSEDAAASAEAASDGFRAQHEDTYVTAALARGQREHGIFRPIWRFMYFAWDDGSELTVDVDAQTGLVITASESPAQPPHALQLHPSYPNPFASSTALRFDLPSAAPVRIAIYDALGRKVALLVDGVLAAGSHTLEWQPEMLPSGLYVARLTSGGFQRSAVLTLVR